MLRNIMFRKCELHFFQRSHKVSNLEIVIDCCKIHNGPPDLTCEAKLLSIIHKRMYRLYTANFCLLWLNFAHFIFITQTFIYTS